MSFVARIAILTAALASFGAARAQTPVVTIATVMSVPAVATFIAIEKGYFREAGVDARAEPIDTLSKANALLATNQIQLAQGGINAGFFNAVGQGLPITLALESGSSPLYHHIGVRPDLKDAIKTPADLKGRRIAIGGVGSLSLYELASVLAGAGLAVSDVDVKIIGFTQMGAALANKSVDVAFLVAPFSEVAVAQGQAVDWINPEEAGYIKFLPQTSLAYLASADWIKKNRDVAQKVVTALLRGGRDYCQAYHHGPNRSEVLDLMVAKGIGKDRAQLDSISWQARDPNGTVNLASVLDMTRFFKSVDLLEHDPAPDNLLDASLAAEAARQLGPFKLINEASPLKGCR